MFKFAALLALVAVAVSADSVSYDGYKVFSVTPQTSQQENILKTIEDEVAGVNFWEAVHRGSKNAVRIMVSPDAQNKFENILTAFEIDYKLIIEDVETVFQQEKITNIAHRVAHAKSIVARNGVVGRAERDFSYFYTADEIYAYLDLLAAEYPDIVELVVIGQTTEGRDITAIQISTSGGRISGDRPVVLVDGTMHAREWISPMVAIYFIHRLVEFSEEHADILDDVDWIIIPMVNVDGFVYTFDGDRMWRKTRSVHPTNSCLGADPNRNADINWSGPGASSNPCSETFYGVSAHSEPEVVALTEFMTRYAPATKLYISLHSYGNYLLWPYTYSGVDTENVADHAELGAIVGDAIYAVNGNRYRVGNGATTLYVASGVTPDYAYGVAGIDFTWTIELPGGGPRGFDIPADRLPEVFAETLPGLYEYGRYIAARYVVKN